MTQEAKDLLLKDLCARLPYRVVISCKIIDFNIEESSKDSYPNHTRHPEYTGNGILFLVDCLANRVQIRPILTDLDYKEQVYFEQMCNHGYIAIKNCKPYLRPMSSMTDEECVELSKIRPFDDEVEAWKYIKTPVPLKIANIKHFDFFHSHHLDWRGLIEKGLTLEAPKGMYKNY